MRRHDHVGKLDQRFVGIGRFFVKRIEPVAAQATRSESAAQRYPVDEIGLRYIDQESSRLDERKLALADEIDRCRPGGWSKSDAAESRNKFSKRKSPARFFSCGSPRQASPLGIDTPHPKKNP